MASLVAQLVKHPPEMQETSVLFQGQEDPLKKRVYTMGFSGGLDSKESTCNVGDLGLIPRLERAPEEGNVSDSSIPA